jgi:chromosome segregation ATPase
MRIDWDLVERILKWAGAGAAALLAFASPLLRRWMTTRLAISRAQAESRADTRASAQQDDDTISEVFTAGWRSLGEYLSYLQERMKEMAQEVGGLRAENRSLREENRNLLLRVDALEVELGRLRNQIQQGSV